MKYIFPIAGVYHQLCDDVKTIIQSMVRPRRNINPKSTLF